METKTYTLLVIDDEDALRDSIAFDFRRKKFNVITAENAEAGIEAVKNNQIDLILSDMRMPGGSGMTVLEYIRQNHPTLPVLIFLTGFSDIAVEECLAKGALRVISKPFDRKELLAAVQQALAISPP